MIMTNQIIGGFMVEAGRKVLAGQAAPPLFYDANADSKILTVRLSPQEYV